MLDAKTEVLAWNSMAAALLGDFSTLPRAERTVVHQAFLGGGGRVELDEADRERLDRRLVGDLRRSAGRYPDDPALRRLIESMRAASPRFADYWERHDVGGRHDDHKTILHPELGRIELDCDVLHVHDDDQVLIVYSAAPGTRSAEALDLLRVVGLQQLAPRS